MPHFHIHSHMPIQLMRTCRIAPLSCITPCLLAGLLTALTGCATTLPRESHQDQVRIDVGRPNVAASPMDSGIYLDDDTGGVRVKYVSRSFLSVLDELAYKAGFSYTVLSDLSHLRVPLFDIDKHGNRVQKRYASPEAMLAHLADSANEQLEKQGMPYRLSYRWRSDGPELGFIDLQSKRFICYNLDVQDPAYTGAPLPEQDCQAMSFKKIFLKYISSAEARQALYALFPSEIESKIDDAQDKPERLKRTFVVEYKAQNALIVRGQNKQIYDRIAKLLPALDAEFNQVIVETKVFQYDDSIGQKIGARLAYTHGNLSVATPFSEGTGTATGTTLPNLLYQFSAVDGRHSLLTQLAMEDKDGLVRILAEPRLVLQSGVQANVKLETKKYFLTTGVNAAGDLRELPSGIDFTVTPTVLGNNKIKLDLVIKQSEFALNNETGVAATTNANEIKTSIVANDGELVSLGGILTRKDAESSSGLIGLRKVPLLGKLFGSEAESSSISRIEFLIRPTVSRSPSRNREFVKAAHDTNCRLDRMLDKDDPACRHEQAAGGAVIDLDATPNTKK